jgi:hypothetical protein
MKIYITNPDHNTYNAEISSIENLANFEGIPHLSLSPFSPEFNKYFKGGRPAVILCNDNDILGDENDPIVVLYGFWQFVRYLEKEYVRL